MKYEIKAEQLYKLIERQKQLLNHWKIALKGFGYLFGPTSDHIEATIKNMEAEIAALEKKPTAMEMIKEVFEPIQLGEKEIVNQALELASKKARKKEKKCQRLQDQTDGICPDCGKDHYEGRDV